MYLRFLQQGCGALALVSAFLVPLVSVSEAWSRGRGPVDTVESLLAAPLPSMSRWAGEELHYSVNMMGGEAARGAITVGRATVDENLGEVVPVEGLIQSVGLLSAMVRFRYGGFTWMDAEFGLPLWGDKLLEDGGRTRSYQTAYGLDDYRVDVTRLENERSRTWSRLTPSRVDDAFSWIFRLRSAPLEVGDVYSFYIFDGWLMRRLHARVVSHVERPEDVTGRKNVMAAELVLVADAMDENASLPWLAGDASLSPVFTTHRVDDVGTMWISLDDRRLPVALEVRTPIGFMRINLSRHVPPSR